MSQSVYFAWLQGGTRVSFAGSFSGWSLIPMNRQGNYFFASLDLDSAPGTVYYYKFNVDGAWQYDLGQPHEDDGSGNWNNFINFGEPSQVDAPVVESSIQHQYEPASVEAKQQPPSDADKPLSKKQQKKQAKQQEKAHKKESQQGNKNQAKHTPEPLQEPEPAEEISAQPEIETAEVEVAEESATIEAEGTVDASPANKGKTGESMVVIDVATADIDTDLVALETFVRSVQPAGLKWEGSNVSDFVFGLKKLSIICRCRDDVSVEDVCTELEKNGDLVGSAQIQSFAC